MVLVAVVECGGFAAAALHLGVTKSAISRRISQLEANLGVSLLTRTTRKISLTEAGERFYAHAAAAAESIKLANLAATELQKYPQGHLQVLSLMSFGRLQVAPLIPEFVDQYPKIQLSLTFDDRTVLPLNVEFDLALRAGPLPDSGLVAKRLASLRSLICASPKFIAHNGTPKTPKDLSQFNCISYSYSSEPTTWTFRKKKQQQVIEVSGSIQVNNSEALCEIVAGGTGIARIPTFIAQRYIEEGRLIPLLTQYTMPSKELYAVFPGRSHVPQKTRVFIDFLANAFSGTTPPWEILKGK